MTGFWYANHPTLNDSDVSSGYLFRYWWLSIVTAFPESEKANLEAVENKKFTLTIINVIFGGLCS